LAEDCKTKRKRNKEKEKTKRKRKRWRKGKREDKRTMQAPSLKTNDKREACFEGFV